MLVLDSGPSRVVVRSGWRYEPPSVVTDAVRHQLGVEVNLVRVGGARDVEVQCRGAVDGRSVRWVPQPMRPPASARPAWHRPGWIDQVVTELDRELRSIGLVRTGEVRHARHTSVTGMLVVPTTAGVLWLKAVLPIFRHEGTLTRWIASGPGSGSVPDVRLTAERWWLSADFAADRPGRPANGDPLATLAAIQTAVADRIGELRDLGVPERDPDDVVEQLTTAVRGSAFLDTALADLVGSALASLRRACEELRDARVPSTVVHGDLTSRNVYWAGRGWLLYDWTDACVGSPFVDLAVATMDDDRATRVRRVRVYAESWRHRLGRAAVETGLRTAPLVGAAHQVASYLTILAGMERTGGDPANGAEMSRLLAYWARRMADAARLADS